MGERLIGIAAGGCDRKRIELCSAFPAQSNRQPIVITVAIIDLFRNLVVIVLRAVLLNVEARRIRRNQVTFDVVLCHRAELG